MLHREALGGSLARETYEAGFFSNNAQVNLALVAPDPVADDVAQEMVDRFVEQHTGRNAYRPAFLHSGADIKQLSINQRDAQYIEQKQFSIEEIARVFHITAVGMLRQAATGAPSANDDFERFLKVDLAPRLRRIEMAFKGDPDLFPRGGQLFPEFLTDAVLRPDIQSRYAAYKDAAQGGWLEGNEIRERENLPVHPQGYGLQQTPVGGAPNPDGQQPANGQVPATTNGGQRG
jgi:HK97 family phage portal protein